ncbi:MAG: hypothetical protein J07HQW1_03085 [Haloquadratum walsbyi J07HQW1]|uniref:Uncharacterized protein n=1 Tax=Haloquadratum walsbyi J07HQW1 TaxID=1238424 RepID=U1PHC0_9EURY|nr:MAG: hypothetical protein J07HQW1_03085 [Haloquadratum walsbyi J07HQW1]
MSTAVEIDEDTKSKLEELQMESRLKTREESSTKKFPYH